ncbi:B3 DNA binding domain-containing protein, partial [Dioscorea alata]
QIPQAFAKHIAKDNHGKATIFILNKFWHVKVQEDEQGLHFGDGWQELTKALDLMDGYNVVFSYEGNMVFTLKVFDLSCCRKYNFMTNHTIPLKKRKIHQTDDNLRHFNVDGEFAFYFEFFVFFTFDDLFLNMYFGCYSDGCESVRPAFQREISESNIVYSYLVSKIIVLSYQSFVLVFLHFEIIYTGKLWSVNVNHFRGTTKFQKGWGKFIQHHNVKSGDLCRFELISKENVIISVNITKAWNVSC